jgi:hypothetical protein
MLMQPFSTQEVSLPQPPQSRVVVPQPSSIMPQASLGHVVVGSQQVPPLVQIPVPQPQSRVAPQLSAKLPHWPL